MNSSKEKFLPITGPEFRLVPQSTLEENAARICAVSLDSTGAIHLSFDYISTAGELASNERDPLPGLSDDRELNGTMDFIWLHRSAVLEPEISQAVPAELLDAQCESTDAKAERRAAFHDGLPSVVGLDALTLLPQKILLKNEADESCPCPQIKQTSGYSALDALLLEGRSLCLYSSPLPPLSAEEYAVQKNIREHVVFGSGKLRIQLILDARCRICHRLPLCLGVFSGATPINHKSSTRYIEIESRARLGTRAASAYRARLEMPIDAVNEFMASGQAPAGFNHSIHAAIHLTRTLGSKTLELQVAEHLPELEETIVFWKKYARNRNVEIVPASKNTDTAAGFIILKPVEHFVEPPLWAMRENSGPDELPERVLIRLHRHLNAFLSSDAMRRQGFAAIKLSREGHRIEVSLNSAALSVLKIYIRDKGSSLAETEFFGIATNLSRLDESDLNFRRQVLLLKSLIERFEKMAWPQSARI